MAGANVEVKGIHVTEHRTDCTETKKERDEKERELFLDAKRGGGPYKCRQPLHQNRAAYV